MALEVSPGLLPESTTVYLLYSEGLGQCPIPYLWPVILLLCGRWSWWPAEHNLGNRTRSVRQDDSVLAEGTLCRGWETNNIFVVSLLQPSWTSWSTMLATP